MPDKHLSTQFDSELNGVSSRVMELGGLVESQIRLAIYALSQFSTESANQVIETEARVNAMEMVGLQGNPSDVAGSGARVLDEERVT